MAPGATDTPVIAFSNPQAVAAKPQETCGSESHRRVGNVRLENGLEQRWEPDSNLLWGRYGSSNILSQACSQLT